MLPGRRPDRFVDDPGADLDHLSQLVEIRAGAPGQGVRRGGVELEFERHPQCPFHGHTPDPSRLTLRLPWRGRPGLQGHIVGPGASAGRSDRVAALADPTQAF
ncbi:MAG: hypothetical protein F4059_00845 [Gemmatimonadetes bacterium]|nr:hypothetical protein [Gemmatimonadota bacterium]